MLLAKHVGHPEPIRILSRKNLLLRLGVADQVVLTLL